MPEEAFAFHCSVRGESLTDNHEFLVGLYWEGAGRFFAPMFEHHCDRPSKTRKAFVAGPALAVGSGHLRAIRDKPRAVLLDNGGEFVVHLPFDCNAGQFAGVQNIHGIGTLEARQGPESRSLTQRSEGKN